MQTALAAADRIPPGSTVYLRSGVYHGRFNARFKGAPGQPITVRSYPGEWAVIDGYLTTHLAEALTASSAQTFCKVDDLNGLPGAFQAVVDGEVLFFGVPSGNTFNDCERGYSGSNGVSAHAAGALVTLIGDTLAIAGSDTIYRDFEVTNSNAINRVDLVNNPQLILKIIGSGLAVRGPRIQVANLVVHGTIDGITAWSQAPDSVFYGNIVYDSGAISSDRSHGHSFYHENSTGTRQILDNIGFNSFDVGMQAYGVTGPFVGGEIRGNIFFNSGAPGSSNGSRNINLLVGTDKEPIPEVVIADNFFYQPPKSSSTNLSIGYGSTSNGAVVITGNYIAGAVPVGILDWKKIGFQGNQLYSDGAWLTQISRLPNGVEITWDGNTYVDNTAIQNCIGGNRRAPFVFQNMRGGCGPLDFSEWVRGTGFDKTSAYTSGGQPPNAVFVRPNRYQAGRAHVVVYNWAQSDAVPVDLASSGLVDGQSFTIVNAQNYFGAPVVTGVYSATAHTLVLPLSSAEATATAAVQGLAHSPSTMLPYFGTFVVVPGAVAPGRRRGCASGVTPCRPTVLPGRR